MSSNASAAVYVTRVIDDGPITGFQVTAIVLCSSVAFLDGLDTQSIAVAAPIIVDNLRLTRAALGPIFSAALLGAMIGALTFGPLCDAFGRKRVLTFAAALFGICTLATAYVQSYGSLLLVRSVAGLGLGGATPCFIALASEYAPLRRRAMVTSLIWAAFPLGGIAGGFLNAAILVHFGWQSIFEIGGVLPISIALVLALWLPESLRYMVATGADPARIEAVVARIRPGTSPSGGFVANKQRDNRVSMAHLFTEGRAATTLLLWIPFFAGFGSLGIAVLWTPILLRDNGIPLSQAAVVLGIHGIGALIGMGSAGRLIEKFGALAVLLPSFLLGALSVGALGYASVSLPMMATALFLAGLFVGAGASGSIALAALTYPTETRSSGIGWAMGVGRFGQVLAPLFAATVVAAGWRSGQMFLAFAIAPVLGALAIVALHGKAALAAAAR